MTWKARAPASGMSGHLDAPPIAAVLASPFAASVVDQDVPHGLSRRRDEVSSPFPPAIAAVPHQANERLVHKGRRLQCLPGPFLAEIARRQPPQLLVYQRQQFLRRPRFTAADRIQELRNVVHLRIAGRGSRIAIGISRFGLF
jgi:hypothetical protein